MRYESRSFRSESYLNNINKENKENQNNLNVKQNKPIKLKNLEPIIPKVSEKISNIETDVSVIKALLKD